MTKISGVGRTGPGVSWIVVVDDQPEMLWLLETILAGAGFEVRKAATIAEGAALIDDTTDLLLADIHIPGGGGIHLANCAQVMFPALPVLFLTGTEPEHSLLRGRPVLLKPFHPMELVAAVDRAIKPVQDAHSGVEYPYGATHEQARCGSGHRRRTRPD